MRTNNIRSKSNMFLLEMVLVILFFSLSSAICARLFVYAHMQSVQSEELSMALIQVQNAAECIKATDGSTDALERLLGTRPDADGQPAIYYNSEWNITNPDSYIYKLSIHLDREQKSFLICAIAVTKADGANRENIYDLKVKKYLPDFS